MAPPGAEPAADRTPRGCGSARPARGTPGAGDGGCQPPRDPRSAQRPARPAARQPPPPAEQAKRPSRGTAGPRRRPRRPLAARPPRSPGGALAHLSPRPSPGGRRGSAQPVRPGAGAAPGPLPAPAPSPPLSLRCSPARRAHAPGRRLIRSSAAAAMARAQARAALSRGCRRWLGGGRAPGGAGSCPRPGGRRGNGCQRGAGAAETFWGTVRGRAGGVLLNASAGVAGDVWRSSSPTLAKAGSLQSHR